MMIRPLGVQECKSQVRYRAKARPAPRPWQDQSPVLLSLVTDATKSDGDNRDMKCSTEWRGKTVLISRDIAFALLPTDARFDRLQVSNTPSLSRTEAVAKGEVETVHFVHPLFYLMLSSKEPGFLIH